jgi:fusaric acid resistance family protein
MGNHWYAKLFQIGSAPLALGLTLRAAVAVGLPLIGFAAAGHLKAGVVGGATAMLVTLSDIGTKRGARIATMSAALCAILVGGTIGDKFGITTYADETLVLLAALIAGWVSSSHPAIATVARFGALATAAGVGMHLDDTAAYPAIVLGGLAAIASAIAMWNLMGLPPDENAMDWRAGLRRALAGTGAGLRFAICYAGAAALALLTAQHLGVTNAYWATLTTIMVMRREGLESIGLVVHYMVGTLLGIPIAALLFHAVDQPLAIALLATAAAASVRVALSLNPGLGFTAFTVFLMLDIDLALRHGAEPTHLLAVRLYDVTIGCAIALLATFAAGARLKRLAT